MDDVKKAQMGVGKIGKSQKQKLWVSDGEKTVAIAEFTNLEAAHCFLDLGLTTPEQRLSTVIEQYLLADEDGDSIGS